jgi:putative heme iron utilization protein
VTPGDNARRLLRRARFGALATSSRRLDGHPFASLVPYVPDHEGRPLILISGLAEHTRNLQQDPRASLVVHAGEQDVLSAARVTCVGRAEELADAPRETAQRYLRYFPRAAALLSLGDFAFFRIEPIALHWIGGFGDIQWIAADAYAPPASPLAQAEADILDHMNSDHPESLRDYCRFVHGREALEVEMVGVDCEGFDVRADEVVLRFDFETAASTPEAVRAAFIELGRRARA